MDLPEKVQIPREVPVKTYSFAEYFKGFEKVDVIRRIFGDQTERVLSGLKVEFVGFRGYMGVSDVDGHIMMSARYLKEGDTIDIYLDIIHELVHVKQFMEGKKLFDDSFGYVDRPTEIEAYRYAVGEARRLGLDDQRIRSYLKTEWITEDQLRRLVKTVGLESC